MPLGLLDAAGTAWVNRWRQLNNFTGQLDAGTFDPRIFQYTPEEYQRAAIGLIPVAGRTIKFEAMQWQPYLDRARLQMQLEASQAAQQAQAQSQAAQDQIQTEADKAAEQVKSNARKAVGRRATILTAMPRQQANSQSILSGITLENPGKTLLGQ